MRKTCNAKTQGQGVSLAPTGHHLWDGLCQSGEFLDMEAE